jgi:hypothetical protein
MRLRCHAAVLGVDDLTPRAGSDILGDWLCLIEDRSLDSSREGMIEGFSLDSYSARSSDRASSGSNEALMTSSGPAPPPNRLVGYFSASAAREQKLDSTSSNLPADQLTHLISAFAQVAIDPSTVNSPTQGKL